jgi:hypothetical protein
VFAVALEPSISLLPNACGTEQLKRWSSQPGVPSVPDVSDGSAREAGRDPHDARLSSRQSPGYQGTVVFGYQSTQSPSRGAEHGLLKAILAPRSIDSSVREACSPIGGNKNAVFCNSALLLLLLLLLFGCRGRLRLRRRRRMEVDETTSLKQPMSWANWEARPSWF